MTVRLSRFGFPAPNVRPAASRVSIFQPQLGLDTGAAPQEVRPGYTPNSQNWVYDAGYITPRSALSPYPASPNVLGDAGIYGSELFDVNGLRYGLIASSSTLGFLPPEAVSWSTLSYVAASGATGESPAGDAVTGWDGAALYDIAIDRNIAVLTNGNQLPKFLTITPSTTTYSDFTFPISAFSRAQSVAAHDNRLVWFNVSSSATTYPVRVQWSGRGNPRDYPTALGGGFEDLMEMRGEGVKVVAVDRDSILLFTPEEIWRGRKRSDIYTYDFYSIRRNLGCPYPRTITATPHGVAFLGADYEVYLVRGDEVVPLGPTGRSAPEDGDASRVQPFIRANIVNGQAAWAVYASRDRSYRIFFSTDASTVYARTALWYYFDNASWHKQSFSHALSGGFEMRDLEEAATWDSIEIPWDAYNASWDDAGLEVPERRILVMGSSGTHYHLHSAATADDGTAIDARYRSHALGTPNAFNYDTLYEIALEADVPSASSASVYVSDDLGMSWRDPFGISVSASSLTYLFAPVCVTAAAPMFELRVNDGSRPRIARVQAKLRDAGDFVGG